MDTAGEDDRLLVAEIGQRRRRPDQPETFPIQREPVGQRPGVADDDEATRSVLRSKAFGAGLVQAAIEAAAKGAGLSQLTAALATVTGAEPALCKALAVHRHAEAYERLRDTSDARARTGGQRPSVFLCNIGPIPQHMARAQFAGGFFNAGGFAVQTNDGFATPEAAAEAFAASGTNLVAICGSDKAYPEWVPRVAPLLRARGAARVIVAGRPGEAERDYRAAGVTDFIFVGCNTVAMLEELLAAAGASS